MTEVVGGRYRILARLGQGGQARIHEGEDLRTGGMVAIKVFDVPPPRAAREVEALRAVRHPNLVELLDHGTDAAGNLYIVEEFIHGDSLSARLDRGPLPPAHAVEITSAVAGALAALHDAGHAHRDVTPGNVILAPEGAVLADLGLAHRLAGEVDLTDPGHLLGTPAYLPPEALAGAARPGPPGDVYMLSVLLWHMLAGQLPWTGPTPAATIARLLLAPPESLVDTAPGIPDALRAVVRRGVAEDPARRFAGPGALAAEAVAVLSRSSLQGSER